MNVHDPILAEGRRLLHVWRSRTRPPAECAAAVLLVIAFVLGSFASPARADEAPDVESTAVPEPTDWEAMGLLPYAGRLEAGLGASITLAAVGSTWFSPAPGATYFASCYGGGPCPDPSVTFAVGMVELPVLAAGLSGMLSWADGQARGPRTGLRGAALLRWREGLQRFGMGATLVLVGSLLTYGDPAYNPLEPNGAISWSAGLTSGALGAFLVIEGQVAMDQALGRRRARSPFPILFGAGILVPKLIVGIAALTGGIEGCEIVQVEEYEGGGTGVLSSCGPMVLPQLGWPSLGWAAVGGSMILLEVATTRRPGAANPVASAGRAHGRTPPLTLWPVPQVTVRGERLTVGMGVHGTW